MKRLCSLLALLGCLNSLSAQAAYETDSSLLREGQLIEEIEVTAHKFSGNSREVAQQVELISAKDLSLSMANSTAGLLEQSGKVFVQRSQLGGGSPVLRGFEASRILLIVDGVRMNNAIYRAGHLQNILTLDEDVLEQVEVLYGPASTIYGSDALGGVIHFKTRGPVLAEEPGSLAVHSRQHLRYSSAYGEFTGHADISLASTKFGSLTSLSFSRFGDLMQGKSPRSRYPGFGKRLNYVGNVNGVDTILTNANPALQKYSGYRQLDLIQKLVWQPDAVHRHKLNVQYSTTSDIPRYDRLTDERDGQLRWAEWYYGPQERFLAAYSFESRKPVAAFDRMMLGVDYQKVEESRMQRAHRKDWREHRIESVDVLAAHIDFKKAIRRHEVSAGADGQFNFLTSRAFKQQVSTGARDEALDTRYPDGKNNMNYTGIYVQHLAHLIPGRLLLNDGLRLNYVTLHSIFVDTALLHLPFTEARQSNITYSANLGLIYLPDKKSKYTLSMATGFRAPNIDDLAKVFESAGGEQVVVPNPGLKPEQTINLDISLERQFGGLFKVELTGFYTWFRNAIVLDAFTLNEVSAMLYNGVLTPVVANQNKARAFVYGMQAAIELEPFDGCLLYSYLTYTKGRYQDKQGEVPMDHIPPLFGKTGISYKWRFFTGEFYSLYHGRKPKRLYNPYGEDNLQYATPDGMPAWYTLNLSTSWKVHRTLQLHAAVENLLDKNYRVFASGISAPGRNWVLKCSIVL